jgi:hypothetical protein
MKKFFKNNGKLAFGFLIKKWNMLCRNLGLPAGIIISPAKAPPSTLLALHICAFTGI